jgi:hypothetical protein
MSFWTKLRDAVESIAVVAGNVVLPGSSLVTSQLVSKGAQKNLSSDLGKVAQLGSGLYGGLPTDMGGAGNLSNYGTGYDKLTGMFTGGADAAGLVGTDAAAMSSAPGAAMDAYGNYVPASYTLGNSAITGTLAGDVAATGGGFLNNLASSAGNYLVPGAILGSSLIGANAASSAANTQAAAQQKALDLQAQQYQQQRADLQPFVAAGAGAQNQLLTYLGLPGGTQGADFGKYTKDFGMSDFTADPGYAFRLSEGQKALERSAAARGGLLSGGTGKRIAGYGQDLASQEYQNAYNRYQTNRANQLNPLFSLTGSGQASATNQAAAAGTYGTQAGQGITNIGAANAAGTVAGANALAGSVGQYLNYTSNQDLANALNTRKTAYTV